MSSALTATTGPGAGAARVYSGQTGQVLRDWFGAPGDALGTRMFALSDLDADGARDLIIFSPGSDVAGTDAGRVQAFSSSTGIQFFEIQPSNGEKITDLLDAGDHDGDGFKDLIVDITPASPSLTHRQLHSGSTGAFLALLGRNEVALGDLNGDGVDDFVSYEVGVPSASETRFTARTLIGAQPYGRAPYAPRLRWVPGPVAPANGALELSGAAASTSIVGVVSFAPANTFVAGTALPLFVSDAPADLYGLFFDVSNAGGGHQDLINLAQPGLAGIKIYVQYGILSASPQTTNAVELMFRP